MQVERRDWLTLDQHRFYFQRWCADNKVERFLFDGDDTIWGIAGIFMRFMDECTQYLATNAPVMTREQWGTSMKKVNDTLFEKYGVNPKRWEEVMAGLASETGLPGGVRDGAVEILMRIYETPPKFLEGSEEGLQFVMDAGTPLGIVTHANVAWTERKLEWLGMSRFVGRKDVYAIDENGHKTAEKWREAMAYFGTAPVNCAVGGDSPRSDINPVRELGVRQRFLVQNGGEIWSVHNQPVDPETYVIARLDGLIGLGEEHLIKSDIF